jgi:hypothetical protein
VQVELLQKRLEEARVARVANTELYHAALVVLPHRYLLMSPPLASLLGSRKTLPSCLSLLEALWTSVLYLVP